jgi:hypothetical protein
LARNVFTGLTDGTKGAPLLVLVTMRTCSTTCRR